MSSKTQLANKNSKTVKSRITWMSRTSDIVGSHMNTDLDSYLTLIRRKIQEKMSTTVELITQIRRFKVGETSHVTPNEFRYTLIKFGIILPQPLVDKIFSVFDSDRSGTMDFDEFAMWIMNSEFQPTLKNKGVSSEDTPRTVHRKKFGSILKENPAWLRGVKTQISFIEFVADINRMNLNISDKEARSIFRIIDGRDSGFVDARVLIRWAETGVVDNSVMQESKPASSAPKDLNKLVAEVIGRNTKQLESAFSHVPRGQSIRITFDEFRRCLLNAGVGKNSYGCKQVFNALGGSKDGLADIDLLFKTLAPVITDPTSEVSAKHTPSNTINTSRADRRLRDAMRKSYKEVKQDIDLADPSNSGYIDADKLFRILIKRCLPLTFQDFRFIIQNVDKEPGSTRIDINHFLHGYNPRTAPHMLAGLSTLKSYDQTMVKSQSVNFAMTMPEAKSVDMVNHTGGNMNQKMTATVSTIRPSKSAGSLTGGNDMRKVWQAVLRDCHRSDPQRTGQIARTAFIAAISHANLDEKMGVEEINRLADQYTVSNGLINYLYFFRSYLNDMVGGINSNSTRPKPSKEELNNTNNAVTKDSLKLRPLHPWEFDYKREKHPDHPYWFNASQPKPELDSRLGLSLSLPNIPPPNEKGAKDLTAAEREQLLSRYDEKILSICSKSYKQFVPIWRALRNEFKKQQITSQRGTILTTNFISIFEKNGISLDKSELGTIVRVFRGTGTQDVVKYDEFLRVCLLVKDLKN